FGRVSPRAPRSGGDWEPRSPLWGGGGPPLVGMVKPRAPDFQAAIARLCGKVGLDYGCPVRYLGLRSKRSPGRVPVSIKGGAMFTIWGARQRFCDGLTRRGFLQIGAFGAGLTLAEMLRLRALAGGDTQATPNKSAVMIYLPGGPSHMDMYDLKPDAPKEFRGEFNPIDTNVPGIQICELMPRQAKLFDKLAVIRSVVSVDEHSDPPVLTPSHH